MPTTTDHLQVDRLSVRERLDLIERLWDSLPETLEPEEVPEWHKELLAQRLAEFEQNPVPGIPWREVFVQGIAANS